MLQIFLGELNVEHLAPRMFDMFLSLYQEDLGLCKDVCLFSSLAERHRILV